MNANNHVFLFKIEETDPADWFYVSEGGKHAIFRYRGHTDIFLSGYLLRIAKSNLAEISATDDGGRGWDSTTAASTQMITEATRPTATVASARALTTVDFNQDLPCQQFQRQIIQPLLCHCYIDLALGICLPSHWCAQLYHRTIASGVIPAARLSSWKLNDADQDDSFDLNFNEDGMKALLVRDHTHLLRQRHRYSSIASHGSAPHSSVGLSVEIKPKAGYIASSPLVLPANRCKYYRTRYSLQQELIQKGQVHKGWYNSATRMRVAKGHEQQLQSSVGNNDETMRAETFQPSNYSPLDLFSGNAMRMQKALMDMSSNMQNNFRVWCNGSQIFGTGKSSPTSSDYQTILRNLFSNFGDYNSDCDAWDRQNYTVDSKAILLNVIISTVTKILERESSLLSNVLSIQQLDWIDGDGAVIIYERLVQLCKGSNSEAEALLDAAMLIPNDAFSSTWKGGTTSDVLDLQRKHYSVSPYTMPKCNALQQLMEEMQNFQSYLRTQQQNYDSMVDQTVDESHFKCIEYVNRLSKEACIYLLQNWLLSLSLCDVSFFVTFQYYVKECTAADGNSILLNEESQTCDHGGIVICSMKDCDGLPTRLRDIAVHYEVKVIDCDPKPAKKLRDRKEVEDAFRFVA